MARKGYLAAPRAEARRLQLTPCTPRTENAKLWDYTILPVQNSSISRGAVPVGGARGILDATPRCHEVGAQAVQGYGQ